jgi:crotonobetainyl-CoA:carnitine CoA-transferase CaiB-like acyl-CoA transferase
MSVHLLLSNQQSSGLLMTEGFLHSITVVELGCRVSVAATGDLLSQLGANVVSIEPDTVSNKHKWRNRPAAMAGKKSVVAAPGAMEKLIECADVVLLSTDVDPEQIRLWQNEKANYIVCDLTAFGHSGPLAGTPLSEGLIEAMCGIADTTGAPHDPPTPVGTPLVDMHAALFAAGAIITALRIRRLHNIIERIDLALFDVGVTSLINFLALFAAGKRSTRSGNRHPLYNPWGTFNALDGSVLICSVTDVQWNVICDVMSRPELAADPRFATSPARLENYEALEKQVRSWVSTRRVADIERLLCDRRVASGRIVGIDELAKDVNLRHRRSILPVADHSDETTLLRSASPFRAAPVTGLSATFVPRKGGDNALVQSLTTIPPIATKSASPAKPFAGVRVVEIGQYTVAPLASRILGALGADVIKVESPAGDAIRKGAPLRSDGASYIFAISNTDKRGIVLDLQMERDRDALHEILQTSDILVENLRPHSLAKQGFDSETLRSRHPNLIYCAINGFGTDSAYPGRPALDTVIQAMSGLMDVTRSHAMPVKAGISASDNLGGQFGFVAIVAALELRARTGQAAYFDLSMQDLTAWATQLEWNGKRSARPMVVKASDGYVAVDAEVAQIPDGATRDDIASIVPNHGAAPILGISEVFTHPQTRARGLVVEASTPQGTTWPVFSLPFKMHYSQTNVQSVIGPLGSTDAEIRAEAKQLIAAKAIQPENFSTKESLE